MENIGFVHPLTYRLLIGVKPSSEGERLALEQALLESGGRIACRTPELEYLHLAVDYPLPERLLSFHNEEVHPAQGVLEKYAHLIAVWMPGGNI